VSLEAKLFEPKEKVFHICRIAHLGKVGPMIINE